MLIITVSKNVRRGERRKERRGKRGWEVTAGKKGKTMQGKGKRVEKIEDRQEGRGGEGENAESSITFRINTYIKY